MAAIESALAEVLARLDREEARREEDARRLQRATVI